MILLLAHLFLITALAEDANPKFTPVCERTQQVAEWIERSLGKKCSEIEPKDLKKIRFMALLDERITSLKSGDFSGFGHLLRLSLDGNPIVELPEDLFRDLTSLIALSLSDFKFTELPEGIFHGLDNLKQLAIYKSKLHTLPPGIFRNLKSLTELTLYINALRGLPSGLFQGLENLRILHLSRNNISFISADQFLSQAKLIELHLERNPIVALAPHTLDSLSELKFLSIGSSYLKHIPDHFFIKNHALEVVDVKRSPLSHTSPAAFKGANFFISGLNPSFNVDPESNWEGE